MGRVEPDAHAVGGGATGGSSNEMDRPSVGLEVRDAVLKLAGLLAGARLEAMALRRPLTAQLKLPCQKTKPHTVR